MAISKKLTTMTLILYNGIYGIISRCYILRFNLFFLNIAQFQIPMNEFS